MFLTHLHSDHVVDLNNIMTVGLFNGVHRVDPKVSIWGEADFETARWILVGGLGELDRCASW